MPAPPPESEPAMVQTMGGLPGGCVCGWLLEADEEEEDAMASGVIRAEEVRLRNGLLWFVCVYVVVVTPSVGLLLVVGHARR